MSDEYICSICGHRAGDHAVSNRCLAVGCDCKDDPYAEQLVSLRKDLEMMYIEMVEDDETIITLRKQLEIANKNIEIDREVIEQYKGERDGYKNLLDNSKKQLEAAVEALKIIESYILLPVSTDNHDRVSEIAYDTLAAIERFGVTLLPANSDELQAGTDSDD